MRLISLSLLIMILLAACQSKKTPVKADQDTAVEPVITTQNNMYTQLHTDTLQYIHFEGNFDYWNAVFINARKDTVQLVLNDPLPAGYRNKLVEVKWFTDTLSEAGDNDMKYAGKRLKAVRLLGGPAFSPPVTEQTVINDVKELTEVQGNADQVGIAERPTDDKEYYLVETGTRDEDKFSRLFMFRVYVYPNYEIKFYDPAGDTEMSLEAWRKQQP